MVVVLDQATSQLQLVKHPELSLEQSRVITFCQSPQSNQSESQPEHCKVMASYSHGQKIHFIQCLIK
jgi:hypothetical protein